MDNGEEIPGLNDSWSFLGAKAMEWVIGFTMMLISTELINKIAVRAMPVLVGILFITTFTIAGIRRKFPDEERGVRNYFMTLCGFAPPGIPRPAKLQPRWSGFPFRRRSKPVEFYELGLDDVFRGAGKKIKAEGVNERGFETIK